MSGLVKKSPGKQVKVEYIGPYTEVRVPEAELKCKQGETISVPPELAERLCEQKTNWRLCKKAAKTNDDVPADEAAKE